MMLKEGMPPPKIVSALCKEPFGNVLYLCIPTWACAQDARRYLATQAVACTSPAQTLLARQPHTRQQCFRGTRVSTPRSSEANFGMGASTLPKPWQAKLTWSHVFHIP
eukprot:2356942-Amphidinium_carterae.1